MDIKKTEKSCDELRGGMMQELLTGKTRLINDASRKY
jgi:hypothetical protein